MGRREPAAYKRGRNFLMPGLACLALLIAAGQAGAQTRDGLMPLSDAQLEEVAAEAEAAFVRMDSNHDQQLSLEEFKALSSNGRQGLVYPRLPAHFRSRDLDQSGFLEAGEFATLHMVMNAGSAAPTLAAADSNGDAKLDFREYVLLMATLDGALP